MTKRIVPVTILAILLSASAIAIDAAGPSDEDATLTVSVRPDGARRCVDVVDGTTEARPSFCSAEGSSAAVDAGVLVDCPTGRSIALGTSAEPLRAVTAESRAGDRDAMLATDPRTGFAVALTLEAFPAQLRVTSEAAEDRMLELPDPRSYCAENPKLTTMLAVRAADGGGRQ